MMVDDPCTEEGVHEAGAVTGNRTTKKPAVDISMIALHDSRGAPGSSSANQASLCLAALRIYLLNEQSYSQTLSERLESSKPLSAASLQTCRQCRETASFHVRVDDRTPRSVWEPRTKSARNTEDEEPPSDETLRAFHAGPPPTRLPRTLQTTSLCSRRSTATTNRVPPVKIAKVTWETSSPVELLFVSRSTGGFPWLSEVVLGKNTSLGMTSAIVWPDSLQRLTFKSSFDICDIAWPIGLVHLALEGRFNQPIDRMMWPDSLQRLTFGYHFNHPIAQLGEKASGLKELTLGWQFDQSLDGVGLPKNLEVLSIGGVYNKPLDRVQLPPGLKSLTLGGHFNLPLASLRFPECLESLSLGWAFDQPLVAVWPAQLKTLALGYRFSQPVQSVRLPSNLEHFELGVFSRQSLKGLVWPSSLKTLTVGRAFDLTGMVLPEGAHVCRRGHAACQVQRSGKR